MESITPERFIELMGKTDKRYIKLWHSGLEKHLEIKYIWKTDPYVWEGKAYEGGSYLLPDLYESKPLTPYDELCSIHNDLIDSCGDVRQEIKDLYIFLKEYESQLKELK